MLLFAKIIRRILQFSDKEEVSIQEEIETLKIYTDLEKLRFHFDVIFDIDPAVDQYNTMIPPLLLQPVVENAIIHGLHPKEGEKALRIEVQPHQHSILFRISDNGVGRGSQENKITDKDRRGLDIVKSRIEIMNKNDINGYAINIIDEVNEEGKPEGTIVEILVPDEK
jgi:LytS/YehU family sensor histidine kinase